MRTSDTDRTPTSAERLTEHSKLVSLLALATGAVAMPQSSQADIIFTDLSSNPAQVGYLFNQSFVITNLPGTAQFGFSRHSVGSSFRAVTVGATFGYVKVKANNTHVALPQSEGKVWSQINLNPYFAATVGKANLYATFPMSYSGGYLAFEFKDSTQAGSPMRFGWVQVGLANSDLLSGEGPQVTIFGYAWDNTGAQVPMGQRPVPEPGSMTLLAFGAMALGAKGVRKWRRGREAAGDAR
jgi:hypothetical protein